MIVRMSRVYIAVSQTNRDELLNRLGRMNLLHFEPVDPEIAVPDEETSRQLGDLNQAMGILSPLRAGGGLPALAPLEAAREAIEIRRAAREKQERLKDLHHRAEELKVWGEVRLDQFEDLRQRRVEVRFFSVPREQAGEVRADCTEMISPLPGKRVLTAVVDRSGQFVMPEGSEPLPLPSQDRPSILAEAKKIDQDLKQDHERLSQLALCLEDLEQERAGLIRKAAYIKARRSGLSRAELFAVKGWLPSAEADRLWPGLSEGGFPVAVRTEPAAEDDAPPTLIRYPAWAKPIKALFDMLGTLPGYREIDLSPFFMLALPLFAAMLISDAGYGFLISMAGLIFYRKLARLAGRPRAQIIIIFGLATLAWGILTADYFGVTPETMAKSGGFIKKTEAGTEVDYEALLAGKGFPSRAARIMKQAGLLWRENPKAGWFLLIKISLIIGCLHLILAHFIRMVKLMPDQRFLAEVGWMLALAGMMVIIWYFLFISAGKLPRVVLWVLVVALSLSSLFGRPAGNPLKRFFLGLSASMLPLLSTFSDIMSYLRLFAIGVASYFIASAFNTLSAQVAQAGTWVSAVPVLIFGHGLNLGLATIAIFAHGVRLNMLEFSNNTGVQWEGYAYRPFTLPGLEEAQGSGPKAQGKS